MDLALFALTVLLLILCQVNAARRPVYNIAHMVNSLQEVDDYLERGANALEADIAFFRNGSVNGVYHGTPCDCFRLCEERENLQTYLKYIRDLADPGTRDFRRQLALLLLDLKVSDLPVRAKYTAGEEVATHILQYLWDVEEGKRRLPVIVSIGHTSDSDVFRGVKDVFDRLEKLDLMDNLGYDVGLNDPLQKIGRMYESLEVNKNRWQGDGISNCLSPVSTENRLRSAIRIRNSSDGYIDKVYRWTVDLTPTMRSSFTSGVDAILTNFPERVSAVLNEVEFQENLRLASLEDSPWERSRQESLHSIVYRHSSMDAFITGLRELFVALSAFFWDVYRFRLQRPLTLLNSLQSLLSRSFRIFPW